LFSKTTIWILVVVFSFLSIMALVVNMPEKKDPAVMAKLEPYIPYEVTKTIGGLDILDRRTDEKLKIDNAKVFIAMDSFTKKWGKNHLRVENDTLVILDDANKTVDTMPLTPSQRVFVHQFFEK
jgi:hypothetical protein